MSFGTKAFKNMKGIKGLNKIYTVLKSIFFLQFRDVFGTAVILFPHLVSTVIVILLLYYFFAIIGLELFSSYNLLNCCKYVKKVELNGFLLDFFVKGNTDRIILFSSPRSTCGHSWLLLHEQL